MILNRRIFRDLRSNFFRYMVLGLIVALSVSIVIGMAASTDSINDTVNHFHEVSNCEDGEFTVYTPLSEQQVGDLKTKGYEIEAQFYVDIPLEKGEIRIFAVRDKINKISLIEGEELLNNNEIVMEQRYAYANDYIINDVMEIGKEEYKIIGIGCVPDYTYVLRNTNDLGTDNTLFGLAFVNENVFSNIVRENNAHVNYLYSYCLVGENTSSNDLKDYLLELTCDQKQVTDTYLKKIYKEISDEKDEMEGGIFELKDGCKDISDGVEQMNNASSEMLQGLNTAQNQLNGYGIYGALSEPINSAEKMVSEGENFSDGCDELLNGIEELESEINSSLDDANEYNPINLSSFVEGDSNKRINAAKDDAVINKMAALYSGIIVFVLIAFISSVFAIHNIDENREIVGTLYAMGYRRKELVKHFILLLIMVVLLGSICGTILGYMFASLFAQGNAALYSYPTLMIAKKEYLIVYGLLMPNVLTSIINYFILLRKLNQKPLSLLRNSQKVAKTSKMALDNISYTTGYQIRQILREKRTIIILFAGLGISILLMVWGFAIYGGVSEYADNVEEDVPCEYTYVLTNPVEEVPSEGEKAYIISAETEFEMLGDAMEVNIMGIKEESRFYTFSSSLSKNKDEVTISDSVAQKFGYKEGDLVVLHNNVLNKYYCLKVSDVVPYSNGLYFFMNIDAMREMTDVEDEEYYNALLSDDRLEVDKNMLLSCITRDEISDVGRLLLDSMIAMVITMIVLSMVLFVFVMYILMKTTIDRSSFSISLLKIFGYSNSEVKKLYLRITLYIVLISIVIHIPLSRIIVELIFPSTVSNVAANVYAHLSPAMYGLITILILLSYFIVYLLLNAKLKKVSFTEVLKQRE